MSLRLLNVLIQIAAHGSLSEKHWIQQFMDLNLENLFFVYVIDFVVCDE